MDYLISISGLALVAAPWMFRYSSHTTAMVSSVVLGLIICVVAGYRAFSKDTHKWEEWVVAIAGVLAIAAPFVFGFTATALWASLILGGFAAALAMYQAFITQPRLPGSRPV